MWKSCVKNDIITISAISALVFLQAKPKFVKTIFCNFLSYMGLKLTEIFCWIHLNTMFQIFGINSMYAPLVTLTKTQTNWRNYSMQSIFASVPTDHGRPAGFNFTVKPFPSNFWAQYLIELVIGACCMSWRPYWIRKRFCIVM